MNNNFLAGLSIEIPKPCLIRQGGDPSLSAPGPAQRTAFSEALGSILQTDQAHVLLQGLNALLGQASNYAITGSAALAVHGLLNNTPLNRQPGDLDVVASPHAMEVLSNRNASDLAFFNMHCEPGNRSHIVWNPPNRAPLKVDIISAKNTGAGAGLDSAQAMDGQRVVTVPALRQNLLNRLQTDPAEPKCAADLAFISTHFPNASGN